MNVAMVVVDVLKPSFETKVHPVGLQRNERGPVHNKIIVMLN